MTVFERWATARECSLSLCREGGKVFLFDGDTVFHDGKILITERLGLRPAGLRQ